MQLCQKLNFKLIIFLVLQYSPSNVLLFRLNLKVGNYFGFTAPVLSWFRSFVSERSECVLECKIKIEALLVKQGVPQRPVLGARLHTLYVRPLSDIFNRHDDADDSQQ